MKSKYGKNNFMIAIISFFLILICFIGMFTYVPPKVESLKTTNGIIEKYEQKGKKWYSYLFYDEGPRFNITLVNGGFYKATGINYDNINHELFDVIKLGKEIKITYIDGGFWSPNDIMSIEYEGTSYLKVDDIIEDMKQNDRISKTICSCTIVITSILSLFLFMLNYKKYRGAKSQHDLI